MKSIDGKDIAKNISVTEKAKKPETNLLVGKIIEGTVKNVTDFGIFVSLDTTSDGLLHKNTLPANLRNSYTNMFERGKKVKVRIYRVTEKGNQLELVQ